MKRKRDWKNHSFKKKRKILLKRSLVRYNSDALVTLQKTLPDEGVTSWSRYTLDDAVDWGKDSWTWAGCVVPAAVLLSAERRSLLNAA